MLHFLSMWPPAGINRHDFKKQVKCIKNILEIVRSLQFYNYHKIGTLDILFVYLFVIGFLLDCFI